MPICVKCGKRLSTEQALQYHYNRKIKCTDLKCKVCNKQCYTKFEYTLHERQCYVENVDAQRAHSSDVVCVNLSTLRDLQFIYENSN